MAEMGEDDHWLKGVVLWWCWDAMFLCKKIGLQFGFIAGTSRLREGNDAK